MQSHNEYHLQMLPYVYTISLQVAGRKSQTFRKTFSPISSQQWPSFVLDVYV